MLMAHVPGYDVEDIQDELSDEQLRSITKQLAYILNEM